jgi:phage antirepressor YoqD-like protein
LYYIIQLKQVLADLQAGKKLSSSPPLSAGSACQLAKTEFHGNPPLLFYTKGNKMSDDLFERQVEEAVQKRVSEELSKITSDPRQMVKYYQELLEIERNESRPKVEFFDLVTQSNSWKDMKDICKTNINWAGKPMGRNTMFMMLRMGGVLDKHNHPYQQYVDLGYFKLVETTWKNKNEEIEIGLKTVVSQKGLAFLIKFINKQYFNGENMCHQKGDFNASQ